MRIRMVTSASVRRSRRLTEEAAARKLWREGFPSVYTFVLAHEVFRPLGNCIRKKRYTIC